MSRSLLLTLGALALVAAGCDSAGSPGGLAPPQDSGKLRHWNLAFTPTPTGQAAVTAGDSVEFIV
ncbi:MAG TPA: hypothetical protein VK610_04975, partial [Rhodothermales bacterium]|nr:hypothetical protein [Rhodothermales bacterium]